MYAWMNGNEQIDLNYTFSDSTGYFEADVSYGMVSIYVTSANGYETNYSGYYSTFFWVDWEETIWKNISLQKIPEGNSQICGYLTDVENDFSVYDAEVLLCWENELGTDFDFTTLSDSEGYYQFRVSKGSGSLHIVHPEYYYIESLDLSIVDENTTKWINISLEPVSYSTDHIYQYTWIQKTGSATIESPMVEKNIPFEQAYTINGPSSCVLTQVTAHINWKDDNTFGLLRTKGQDTLTAEVSLNGKSLEETSEMEGDYSFAFNVNSIPQDGSISGTSMNDAASKINEEYAGKNSADFDVLLTIEIGEPWWRFLLNRDDGNEVDISFEYTYYVYELEQID